MATSIGEAFIDVVLNLPAQATKGLEASVDKAGVTAGKSFGDQLTKEATKAAGDAGTKAGQALAKTASDAANKMSIKTPDVSKAYGDAGKKAGEALSKSVSDSANKMQIKTPDVTREYTAAGAKAGEALSKAVGDNADKLRLKTPNVDAAYKAAGESAGQSLAKSVEAAAGKANIKAPPIASEFEKEGEKAGRRFTDRLKGATSTLGNIGSVMGVQLITAFDSEADLSKTTRKFQQQLGTTKDEAKALGLAAGSLYANGLSEGMDDAEEAILSVVNNISGIREKGLPAIKEVAQGALGISKAFGQDVDSVLRATGQLMRTGLAKDGKEALDIIAGGLQKIPGAAEDLLDTFTEYSVQFKKIGLDGKDALGIINQLVEGGARNTDLAADALKEFSIRAIDGSKAVEDAFTEIGLDAEKMSKTFAEGGPAARKAFGDVVDALNKMEDPLKRNQAGVELFGTQWEDLGDAFKKADLKTASKELGELNGVADQVGGNTFGEKMKANLSKLSGVATGIAGVLGLSFATSFDDAMDFKTANEKVARDLGLSVPQAKQIGKAAGDIYASGLGDGLGDVSEAISTVGKALPSIAKQGVPALAEVTKGALALQKNFDVDISDSATAVGKLMKTGLAKNADEAFDLIATGMAKIPGASEDLLDTLNEYPVQFQKLGLSGKDTLGLIKQMMEGGARSTDLAADALKEFSLRAIDGSTGTKQAFKDIGLNATEMQKTFAKGGPEARKAFGEVLQHINSIQDPVKRNTAGVALFGTQWEDLGGAFKSANLDTAAASLGKVEGANKAVIKSSPTAVVQQFQRAIQVAFIEILADKVIPAFAKFIKFVQDNQGLLKTLAVAVAAVGAAYVITNAAMAVSAGGGLLTFIKTAITSTKAWTVAQTAFNFVLKDNPIGIVVTAIGALVAIIVVLYKNNETVRKAIDAAWKAIKEAMKATVDWFVNTAWPALKKAWDAIKPAIDAVGKAIKAAWDAVKAVFTSNTFLDAVKTQFENFKTTVSGVWKVISGAVQAAWAIIKGVFDVIKGVLTGDFKGAWEGLQTMISGVWEGIKKIISGAWDIIKSSVFGQIISYLGKELKQAWDALSTAIKSVWDTITKWISEAWNAIKTVFTTIITFLSSTFKAAWDAYSAAVKAVWDAIKLLISTWWDGVKIIFNAVITFLQTTFKAAWDTFKTLLDTTWTAIKTLISTAWDGIKSIFTTIITFLSTTFKAAWDTFKTLLDTTWTAIKTLISLAWDGIKAIFTAVITFLATTFKAAWDTFKTLLQTTWTAISTLISTAWTNIKTLFGTIITYLQTTFKNAWDAFKTAVNAVWSAIKEFIGSTWTNIKAIFTSIITYLAGTFKTAWNNLKSGINTVWEGIKTLLSNGWTWIKTNVFSPITNFITKDVPGAFTKGIGFIKTAWDKLTGIVQAPVKTFVDKVINGWIIAGFNAVASKVGVGKIDPIKLATGGVWSQPTAQSGVYVHAATGAVLPGYTPGRDVHQFYSPTGGRLALSGGEAVMRPEFTKAIGKAGVNRLNAAARSGGASAVRNAMQFANGGVVQHFGGGGVLETFSSWWEDITGMAHQAADVVKLITGGVKGVTGSSPFLRDIFTNAGKMLIDGVKSLVTGHSGSGGGSAVDPAAAGGAGGKGYQWQIDVLRKAGLNPRITSTTGGTHATGSYHYRGRAIDIGNESFKIFNWIAANYGSSTAELIYGPAGSNNIWHGKKHNYGSQLNSEHMDHIHWAYKNGGTFGKYDDGGWLKNGHAGVNLSGKPEAVLTPEESKGLKNLGADELLDKLDELIDAVERIAPGVGGYIRGSGRSLTVQGRSV